MSAVSMQVAPPYYAEALNFWQDLAVECERQACEINGCLGEERLEPEKLNLRPTQRSLVIEKQSFPTTEVRLTLSFDNWGPTVAGIVSGRQNEDLQFFPDEFDLSLGCDEDAHPVAITSEGKSLSPHAFAKWLMQNFRRCYSGVSLPCSQKPF